MRQQTGNHCHPEARGQGEEAAYQTPGAAVIRQSWNHPGSSGGGWRLGRALQLLETRAVPLLFGKPSLQGLVPLQFGTELKSEEWT